MKRVRYSTGTINIPPNHTGYCEDSSSYLISTYGESIEVIMTDDEGRMWAICEDEPLMTQINFDPFTGEPAKKKIGE